MRIKNVIKRISIFFLAFIVLFSAIFLSTRPKEVKAVVPAIAVGISAIAAFFGAAGVSLTAQNMTSDNYASAIQNYADEYSSSSGTPTIEDYVNTKDAINYYYNDKAGEAVVSVSNDFSQWLNGFKNWFVQNFALTDSGETVVINDTKVSFLTGDYPYYSSFRNVFSSSNVPLSSVPVAPSTSQFIELDANNTVTVTFSDVTSNYGYYWMRVSFLFSYANGTTSSNSHNYMLNTSTDWNKIKVLITNTNYTSPSGYFNFVTMPLDSGSYSDGYTFHTNWKVSDYSISSIGLSGSLTDGYSDFEQALTGAQTDAGENGQIAIGVGDVVVDRPYTKENVAEGILNNTIANTGEGVLVGGYADDKEVEEENDVSKVPTAAEIGNNVILVDGLEDFFPFCIPFDLYEIVNLLNVPAEAPKFDWKMSFADRFDDYDISIDLTPYNTVAAVFRTMIIIAFLIFLTLKTRDLIRG